MAGEAPKTYKLGPGTLTIGETGGEVDMTAQITAATVAWSKDKENDVPVLSGGVLSGDVTYTAALSATLFQDLSVDGLVEFSWANKGTHVAVEFTPSTAEGRAVTGTIEVDPIDIGGDVKTRPTSDIEWAFVGEPVFGAAGGMQAFGSFEPTKDEVEDL